MKRKIAAIILTLALAICMMAGCGDDGTGVGSVSNSTYFKQLQQFRDISTGTATVEGEIQFSNGYVDEDLQALLATTGLYTLRVKAEITTESAQRSVMKVYACWGDSEDYWEITTLVFADNMLYASTSSLINVLSSFDAESASYIQESMTSLGITDYISLNMDQISSAQGMESFEFTEEVQNQLKDFIVNVFEAADENFSEFQGRSSEGYTLTINGDNASALLPAISNFLNNDAGTLLNELADLSDAIYGSGSTTATYIREEVSEFINRLPEVIEACNDTESQSEFANQMVEMGIDITSTALISGSQGRRKSSLSFDTGLMVVDETRLGINLSAQTQEGTPSIDSMIPQNAVDMTAALLSQMGTTTY